MGTNHMGDATNQTDSHLHNEDNYHRGYQTGFYGARELRPKLVR
jgi:hypothetical protein